MNFLGATRVSIGSVVELGHAAAMGKFIIVAIDTPDEFGRPRNPHEHPFVLESASVVVRSLDHALRILSST
jgi:hypothetical protein